MPVKPTPSFSVRRRWAIFFSVLLSVFAMVALVLMINYLGAHYYLRRNFSAQTRVELSPMTLSLLKSMTNEVKVTVYYDPDEPLYPLITSLLDEYRLKNPAISVRTVDYNRDASEALKVKAAYRLTSAEAKNLVIFESGGRYQVLDGKFLADVDYAAVANTDSSQPEFEQKIRDFKGEEAFSDALYRIINPITLKACYLEGNGEHPLDSDSTDGYSQFKSRLENINIQIKSLSLEGTNPLPADCGMLIIAGPQRVIPEDQLEKVRQYLARGGKLLALFHYDTAAHRRLTGLEALLAEWGVGVGMNWMKDTENGDYGDVLVVKTFNANHPLVRPFAGQHKIGLLLPRSVGSLRSDLQNFEGLKIDELAFTGKAVKFNDDELATKGPFPLMVAVEKGDPKGVFSERGNTRIVVAGDSNFLSNRAIEIEDNKAFAVMAANWLLNQGQTLDGIGPRRVIDSKLMMTRSQLNTVQWIFLGAMPGAVLVLGGLVWLRRRR